MKRKHTSGSWRYTSRNIDGIKDWASRIPFAIEVPIGCTVVPVADVCDQPQAEANARLIAAAPDLLNALASIVEMSPELPMGMIEAAQAAVEKATGERTA